MKYVIIGVGAAGIMAAKTIRKADKESSLTMISLDAQVNIFLMKEMKNS